MNCLTGLKLKSEGAISRKRVFKTGSERLIERANRTGTADPIGISAADIDRIPLTTDLIDEIEEFLASPDVAELKWGCVVRSESWIPIRRMSS